MLIAIMSDSHDHYENFEKAIKIANEKGCEKLLFAGDLIAPGNGIELISKFNGDVIMIIGNNDAELLGLMNNINKYTNVTLARDPDGGNVYEGEIDNIKIFMHHYPRMAELALSSQEFDICICGHSHEYRLENNGSSQLINPGAIHPYKTKATFAILNTSNKKIDKIEI